MPVVCLLLVWGCGSPTGATTPPETAASVTTSSATTSSAAPQSTTHGSAGTTTLPSTSAAPTSPTPTTLPTLDDGRPATFLAVTVDYEAVEVDTATGAIVRRIGQRADAQAVASAVEIAPNVVDGVWRTVSGATILVSECCEPAAGHITLLADGDLLDPDHGDRALQGWWVVPSPKSDEVIVTGYTTEVVDAATAEPTEGVTLFENDGSGVGAIGWSPDGSAIHWYDERASELVTWDRSGDGFVAGTSVPIGWIGPDQRLSGLDSQASGYVVSFLTRYDVAGDPLETTGVVYSPQTGDLIAEFTLPPGSFFGGYDPSGRYLIYTTPSGAVTYQGVGGVAELAEGYLFASW